MPCYRVNRRTYRVDLVVNPVDGETRTRKAGSIFEEGRRRLAAVVETVHLYRFEAAVAVIVLLFPVSECLCVCVCVCVCVEMKGFYASY